MEEDLEIDTDTITRHRTKLTSLTLQSLKKVSAMIEDANKPPVKLAHGHYDSLEDMRLEADIDRERISVEVCTAYCRLPSTKKSKRS